MNIISDFFKKKVEKEIIVLVKCALGCNEILFVWIK